MNYYSFLILRMFCKVNNTKFAGNLDYNIQYYCTCLLYVKLLTDLPFGGAVKRFICVSNM